MAYIGKPILAIDFDGTIRKSKRAIDIGSELMPNCKRVLKKLYDEGFRMILWTCRSKAWCKEVVEFMEEEDILKYFECINENIPNVYWWDTRKIYADVYIDDLNLQGFPGWLKTYDILKRRFLDG
ncbi:hypothetical protein KAU34_10440 [candidate division WOR-3 bacterium]|nr:hypothetical protein [candidate division WOR-3 bacterium]